MRFPLNRLLTVSTLVIAFGAYSPLFAFGQAVKLFLPEDDPFKNAQPISSIAFSPDGKLIATGHRGTGLTVVWDANSGERLMAISSLKDEVRSVAFSPDGKRLAVLELPGLIRLIGLPEGNEIRKFELNDDERMFYSIAFFPNGKHLAAGVAASIGRPGSDIQILELESGKLVRTLVGHTWMVTSVDVSPDGKLLASGAWDGTARIWDTQTGNSLATLTFPEPKKNGGVKQTAEELEEESFEEEIANHVHSVEFSPNGRMLSVAAGGGILSKSGGKIGLWDVATSKLKSTFKLEDSSVQQVLFSPNGNVILTAGADGLTKLWDAVSFKEVGKAEGCYPVAFSPDGKTIAATLDYRTVLVRKRSDPK